MNTLTTQIGPSMPNPTELDLWIVSHGGTASNAVTDYLESEGYKVRPSNIRLIAHKQHPGVAIHVPILFIRASNITMSILSMYRRRLLAVNAMKMIYGLDVPEISLTRILQSQPRTDPLGICRLIESHARAGRLDRVSILEYPFNSRTLRSALKGLNITTRTPFKWKNVHHAFNPIRDQNIVRLCNTYSRGCQNETAIASIRDMDEKLN